MDYLYNGIELPVLPEYDTETYPISSIGIDETYGTGYRLNLHSVHHTVGVTGARMMRSGAVYNVVDGKWVECDTNWIDYTILWCNADVYYHDSEEGLAGTLYLAASDPIPVSNPPAPDPFWMLMGWQAGRMIAGMRGKKN